SFRTSRFDPEARSRESPRSRALSFGKRPGRLDWLRISRPRRSAGAQSLTRAERTGKWGTRSFGRFGLMGVGRIQAKPRTAPSVRTVVRAAVKGALPADLMNWAAQQSVRIVSRGTVNEAIAAARDTNAALLIVHCELVRHDAGLLGSALMKAQ